VNGSQQPDGSYRVSSVIQLAKYPIGSVLYRVVFRPVGIAQVQIPPGEEWMAEVHPKILFERGLANKSWKYRAQLPRLCALDFQYVTELLTSEPIVERFVIQDVDRSLNTGEFYYMNADQDWMPESTLFESALAAKREKIRIKHLFELWASRQSPDEV
jgi:hypothetical protein